MNTDPGLIAALDTSGHWDADGIHRGARLSTCRDCGRRTMVGLDAEWCAVAATTDAHEIDHLGEYLALRIGIPTYSLTRSFSKSGKRIWTLDTRMLAHIEAPRRTPVVAAHRCGIQIPPAAAPFLPPQPAAAARTAGPTPAF